MPLDLETEPESVIDDVIDYLKRLDRLVADFGCDCASCRVIVAALPPFYILDETTEIREHALIWEGDDEPVSVQLVATSKTLPPLTFDAEHGWQAPERH